jgi:hypothetical protein
MSHRDTCPDPRDARREGERAHDNGYGSFRNPYGGYGEERCEEAEHEWRSGWYAAERREQERAEEAAYEALMRRAAEEERAQWEALYEQREYDEQAEQVQEAPPSDSEQG